MTPTLPPTQTHPTHTPTPTILTTPLTLTWPPCTNLISPHRIPNPTHPHISALIHPRLQHHIHPIYQTPSTPTPEQHHHSASPQTKPWHLHQLIPPSPHLPLSYLPTTSHQFQWSMPIKTTLPRYHPISPTQWATLSITNQGWTITQTYLIMHYPQPHPTLTHIHWFQPPREMFRHFIPLYRNDPKFSDRYAWANSADPDQTAPRGAVWSGSTLFAIPSASFGLITLW